MLVSEQYIKYSSFAGSQHTLSLQCTHLPQRTILILHSSLRTDYSEPLFLSCIRLKRCIYYLADRRCSFSVKIFPHLLVWTCWQNFFQNMTTCNADGQLSLVGPSETSVRIYQTIDPHIPEGNVFLRCHGTLKPGNQRKLQISSSHIILKAQPLHVADKGGLVWLSGYPILIEVKDLRVIQLIYSRGDLRPLH